ncbi:MAG: aldolase/citrate lyase family protein [Alphaproteobacteria bacterium]|nr:aldolase/citrate lyase family protein [Alphaproteobacteria bacterium]
MRPNKLKQLWAEGKAATNVWASLNAPVATEALAHSGADAVVVDLQHGMIGESDAIHMLQAISTTDTVPFARCPWNEPGIIMKLLDGGAYGIICPMINTAEEAARFVSYCKYPPDGQRSSGPVRATMYAGADYVANANAEIVTLAMIETKAGLDNLDAICATPGLDGVFIGPSDLALALGRKPGPDSEDPVTLEAIDRILAAAKAAGKVTGIFCASSEYAQRMIDKGMAFVTVTNDVSLLMKVPAQMIAALKVR